MARRSKLLTAGDKAITKKSIPRKPLTTQGKIVKAQALKGKKQKNEPREPPPDCENVLQTAMTSDDSPAPKKAKARSFAPPDETDYLAGELKKRNLAKARGTNKEGWNIRKKPLTTLQKIAAAQAIKRAKGGQASTASTTAVSSHGKKEVPGLMSILKMQDREFLPMTKEGREKGEGGGGMMSWNDIKSAEDKREENKGEQRLASILFQPTLRARKWRAVHGVQEWPVARKVQRPSTGEEQAEKVQTFLTAKDGEHANKIQPAGTAKEGKVEIAKNKPAAGWFADFPDEVRTRIWKLVVVDDESCIWPTSPTGREQPDVAMTCKQIRCEVLPIYYGHNTFGISLQKEAIGSDPAKLFHKKALTGLAAVHKWATAIGNEDVTWLSMVQNWAFEYQDPAAAWGQGAVYDDEDSFVISMQMKSTRQDRPERQAGLEEEEASDELPTLVRTTGVEVHIEASCFMRAWTECGKCWVPATPAELDAAVTWMLQAGISANTLYRFANELRGMRPKLTRARCVRSGGGKPRP